MEYNIKFSRLLKLKYDTFQTFFILTSFPRAEKWGDMWDVGPPEQ